jgi:HEAT repeat protein
MEESAESIEKLIRALQCEDAVVRTDARRRLAAAGAPAVPSLIELLHSPEKQVRWEAAKTLESSAHVSAAPALVEALGDPDPDVCWVAAEALSAIGVQGLKPLLDRLVCRPRPGQPFPDSLYRGAHHVLHRLADRTADAALDRLVAALGRDDAEIYVPAAAQEVERELDAYWPVVVGRGA